MGVRVKQTLRHCCTWFEYECSLCLSSGQLNSFGCLWIWVIWDIFVDKFDFCNLFWYLTLDQHMTFLKFFRCFLAKKFHTYYNIILLLLIKIIIMIYSCPAHYHHFFKSIMKSDKNRKLNKYILFIDNSSIWNIWKVNIFLIKKENEENRSIFISTQD